MKDVLRRDELAAMWSRINAAGGLTDKGGTAPAQTQRSVFGTVTAGRDVLIIGQPVDIGELLRARQE